MSPRRGALPLAALPFAALLLWGCGGTGEEARGDAGLADAGPLASPPALRVGDWWEVEVDPTLVGETFPATLVVTEVDGGRARIGMTPETFRHDFLVLHVPVLGDVDLATYAWRVMWDDFAALHFPLEPGGRWSADFHGNAVEAEVTRVEGSRAWVTFEGERDRIELVYDADAGMITDFREEALELGFRVTGHGSGYTGEVISLGGISLGMMEGGPSAFPGQSEKSVEVTSVGTHGSLSLVVWNRGTEAEGGRYHIRATAPDGTTFEHTFETEPGAPAVLVRSFGHARVQGEWKLDFEREGPASLLVELFTYDREEVQLMGGSP